MTRKSLFLFLFEFVGSIKWINTSRSLVRDSEVSTERACMFSDNSWATDFYQSIDLTILRKIYHAQYNRLHIPSIHDIDVWNDRIKVDLTWYA